MDDHNNSRRNKQFFDTEAKDSKSNSVQIPSITLPKGGGAIKNIDGKFSVNASNGTSSFSIPFPFSKSRNDFMPSTSLIYNSGAGNGIFGLGWSADIPSITRKTEKELPQYKDEIESDTFIFSSVEDLIPRYNDDGIGKWIKNKDNYKVIIRYLPRIEGIFTRIERVKNRNDDS